MEGSGVEEWGSRQTQGKTLTTIAALDARRTKLLIS
jgi:hypothetical protein